MKKYVSIIPLFLSLCVTGFSALNNGDIVEDFSMTQHGTEETISLYDYEGHVIVLDFFAYWCGPCQTSSPKLEKEVADFYESQGGTANGVPVTVLAVSVDNKNPSAVDSFVENAGLKLVGLDTGKGWRQFSKGYVPHFAVVNGVADSNYEQWEVIHTNYGFAGTTFYKNQAELVLPSVVEPSGYEVWANEQIEDAEKRGVLDDVDGDGLSNLIEYACDSDPESLDAHSPLECLVELDGSYLFRFWESKSAVGVENLIEFSDDLENWTQLIPVDGTESKTDFGDLRKVEMRVSSDAEVGRFWRRVVRESGLGLE